MGKKNKKSSGDDLAKTKKHKKSSTTEVETAHVSSSKNAHKGDLKKQISEEVKEMWQSIKELTEAVKRHEKILQTIAEGKDKDYCNFECDEAEDDHKQSICVKGPDKDMDRRKDIKQVLYNVFGSCGKIESTFVPIACQTGVPLGFAFITFEDRDGGNEKALKRMENP